MMAKWVEGRRTCLAYSPGGHFTELNRAISDIEFTDCFHVSFDSGRPIDRGTTRLYLVEHPRRNILNAFRNVLQSAKILWKERPHILISTGADVAVPIFVLGRLFGATTIFIETGGSLEPTLSGRLCYPFANLFVVQWPSRLTAFPRATLASGLLL